VGVDVDAGRQAGRQRGDGRQSKGPDAATRRDRKQKGKTEGDIRVKVKVRSRAEKNARAQTKKGEIRKIRARRGAPHCVTPVQTEDVEKRKVGWRTGRRVRSGEPIRNREGDRAGKRDTRYRRRDDAAEMSTGRYSSIVRARERTGTEK